MKKFNPLKYIIFINQNKIKLKLDYFTYEIITSLTKMSYLAYKSSHKIIKRKHEMKMHRIKSHSKLSQKKVKKNVIMLAAQNSFYKPQCPASKERFSA